MCLGPAARQCTERERERERESALNFLQNDAKIIIIGLLIPKI